MAEDDRCVPVYGLISRWTKAGALKRKGNGLARPPPKAWGVFFLLSVPAVHRRRAMAWWDRVVSPMRRVWIGVAARLGVRKTGLRRLRKEVSTCEYEDVHVMWGLLMDMNTSSSRRIGGLAYCDYLPVTSAAASTRRRRRGRSRAGAHVWNVLEWAQAKASSFHLCRSF